MSILLQPGFFGPIIQYVAMAAHSELVFEKEDNSFTEMSLEEKD